MFLFSRDYLFEMLKMLPYRIPVLLIALTMHEFFHAFAADRLGDPTPRNNGRLSLNPLRHLDPFGTIMILIVGIGWAKPVYISPVYFRNRKRDTAIVSVAGPLTNFALAAVSVFLFYFLMPLVLPVQNEQLTEITYRFLELMIWMNVMLGIFNLLPVPPLDGSKILAFFLPDRIYMNYLRYEQYGYIILILLLVFGWLSGPIAYLAGYIIDGFSFVFGNAGSYLAQLITGGLG